MSSEGARFRTGDRVRVRSEPSRGHVRTPAYIKGKLGVIERLHGTYGNPESLAYGGDGLPRQPLYLVGFDQRDIWPGYQASLRDTLLVDIYENWLEPAAH